MNEKPAWQIYLEHRGAGRPRFYAARLRAVGGRWLVARHWGFVGRAGGWHRSRVHATEAEAERELARLAARRRREGYRPASEARREVAHRQLAIPIDGETRKLG